MRPKRVKLRTALGADRASPLVRVSLRGELQSLATGTGPADVIIPAEWAPVVVVQLPLLPYRQLATAAAFQLEDRLAEPLEAVHVAIGAETKPPARRAAFCSHALIQGWLGRLKDGGVAPRRLVIDADCLPAPAAPAEWTVCCNGDRRLIRTGSGEAFALPSDVFPEAWAASGKPALTQAGEEWDRTLPEPLGRVAWPERPPPDAIDLLQGPYRSTGSLPLAALGPMAAILGAAILAHSAIVALDTRLIARSVDQERARAIAWLADAAPLTPPEDDVALQLERLFLRESKMGEPSALLEDLAAVAGIARQLGEPISFEAIAFDSADNALRLDLEMANLQALDQLQRALNERGLATQSEGAELRDGGAHATIVVVSEKIALGIVASGEEKIGP